MQEPEVNPTYKSLNNPLTILGVERRLFFGAVILGASTFNFFSSFVGGVLMFAVLYLSARHFTAVDPEILRIVINAARLRIRYDAAKYDAGAVRGVRRG